MTKSKRVSTKVCRKVQSLFDYFVRKSDGCIIEIFRECVIMKNNLTGTEIQMMKGTA